MTTRYPDTLEPADTWRRNAACANPLYAKHRNLWFPAPTDTEATRAAKQICADCPVLEQCATWALAAESRTAYGVA